MVEIQEMLCQAINSRKPGTVHEVYKMVIGKYKNLEYLKYFGLLYFGLYVPRMYHKTMESVGKAAFDPCAQYNPKLTPEALGFETLVSGGKQ